MTVSSETNRSGPYNGNGVTTAFDYEFRIVDEAHIRAVKTSVDGIETTLTLTTDYSVSGVGDAEGGQVTLVVAPAVGEKITLLLSVPFLQEIDLENQGAYYAETVERGFDLAAMRDKQLFELLARAVLAPVDQTGASLPVPDPTKILGWGDGGSLINVSPAEFVNAAGFATAAQGDKADTAVQPARTVSAGAGLTGGGSLSADRTIALSAGTIASLAKADSAMQSATGILSQTPSQPIPLYLSDNAKIHRIHRLFVGDAGFENEGDQPGNPTIDPTELLIRPAMGKAATVAAYSQTGHIGMLGFSQTLRNGIFGSMGCIGVAGVAVANNGSDKGAEAGYFEARNLAGAGGVIGVEIDVFSTDATHTAVPGAMIPAGAGPRFVSGLHLAAGGEDAGASITSALSIIDNGSFWKSGIMMRQGAIVATTWYTRAMKLALALAYDHDNVWFYTSSDKPARRDTGGFTTFFKSNAGNDIIGSIAKHAGDDAIALFGGIATPSLAVYSSGQMAFFNKAVPAGQQSVSAAATDAATTQTLANSLRTALINLGIAV